MRMRHHIIFEHRINNPVSINVSEIKHEIELGKRVIVQFSQPQYTSSQLKELNDLSNELGRNLEIRFYGHYADGFDASVLRFIPNASRVSINCLTKARNLKALSALIKIKELNLGVFELDEKDILSIDSLANLESLNLGPSKNSNIDLLVLQNYSNLSSFHTTGHTKNLDVLTKLPKLVSLSLSQIKKSFSLAFVSDIKQLADLRIILGGRTSISEIIGTELKNLEIIRVQGLEELGEIGRFSKLEMLLIEDQIKVNQVKLGPNPFLRDIKIINCKTLDNIDGISTLNALTNLHIYQTAIEYEKFISSGLPITLQSLSFYTSKKKKDSEIQNDLALRGFTKLGKMNIQPSSNPTR